MVRRHDFERVRRRVSQLRDQPISLSAAPQSAREYRVIVVEAGDEQAADSQSAVDIFLNVLLKPPERHQQPLDRLEDGLIVIPRDHENGPRDPFDIVTRRGVFPVPRSHGKIPGYDYRVRA
jgi:hypothetical protein